jgi:hypothetical protein
MPLRRMTLKSSETVWWAMILNNLARFIAVNDSLQDWIGIDRLTFPPTLVRAEPINREMELRCVWRCISCRADV